MGLSQETERAKPLVHLFLSIFIHNLRSKIPLPPCQNADVLHHVAATLAFVLQL
jgi:hypothetical protein